MSVRGCTVKEYKNGKAYMVASFRGLVFIGSLVIERVSSAVCTRRSSHKEKKTTHQGTSESRMRITSDSSTIGAGPLN